jgi:hypothetical protein
MPASRAVLEREFGSAAPPQTYTLTVSADTTPPTVNLQLDPNPLGVNNQETFLVFASDNVAVTKAKGLRPKGSGVF